MIENEKFAVESARMTNAHLINLMFTLALEEFKGQTFKDERIVEVIFTVLRVFGLKQLSKDTMGLYESGYFGPETSRTLNDSL